MLAELSHGHTNKQIAASLWLSEQTVKFHLRNVYRARDQQPDGSAPVRVRARSDGADSGLARTRRSAGKYPFRGGRALT